MDDMTLLILGLLEAILVLLALLGFLLLKNRRLRQQLASVAEPTADTNPGADEAAITAPDDSEALETLAELTADEGIDEDDSELQRLRERVQVLQERIDNLEQFKAMFFEFKDRLASQENLIEKLQGELEQAMAGDGDLAILQATVEQLSFEKSDLQDRVAAMARQLTASTTDGSATGAPHPATVQAAYGEGTATRVESVNESGRRMSEEVDGMRGVLNGQEDRIREMGKLIGELRLEVDDKSRLEQITAELESRAQDLSAAVDRLEQENDFLQDQITALLQQEIARDDQFTNELQRVQEHLASKEQAFIELEQQYAAMEQQYLDVYNQLQRQKSG